MNYAEKVKKLAQKFAEAHSHYCLADDGEPADYALEWRREAVNNLHAAIDEMQSDIDRMSKDAARYRLIRLGQCFSVVDGAGDHLRDVALDEAIDAAMKARGDKNEPRREG